MAILLIIWLSEISELSIIKRESSALDSQVICDFLCSPPNQSLKLTEIAVDDFAARQYAENDMINRYVRAMNYMELTVRRRSLAPIR